MVGFFRRICKLLFFGVKPVFVFDGGAPALKRRTVGRRRERREGRREDAVRTAGKLLAVQMQRRMEEEEDKKKKRKGGRGQAEEGQEQEQEQELLPENLVYVEELQMTAEERTRKRQSDNKFRKKDAYHLPALDTPLAEMGAPNDPRIMSLEELQNYARQFDTGEDINIYDFSKIDFDSPFFQSLPDSDRYNILNAARLRSRLRMGYSKDQLDTMFPDRMAFSKFQIDRVRERNELTQRLMNINGAGNEDDTAAFGFNSGGRVAGEKGREYVLVRNDGVEGGWALGVVDSKDEGKARNKPIDVDEHHKRTYRDNLSDGESKAGEGEDEDDNFEDIPVEGLNRLPTRPAASHFIPHDRVQGSKQTSRNHARTRRELYTSRKREAEQVGTTAPNKLNTNEAATEGEDSLFLAEDDGGSEMWEDVHIQEAITPDGEKSKMNEEEAQLQQAIQMSLQQDESHKEIQAIDDTAESLFGVGTKDKSNHSQEHGFQPKHGIVNDVDDDDDDDDGFNLHTLLSEARQTKRKVANQKETPSKPTEAKVANATTSTTPQSNIVAKRAGFDGPLPFEKLNLGTSLLGRKKMQKLTEELEGGFEKEPLPSELKRQEEQKKEAVPLPPWFTGGDTGLGSERKTPEEGKISGEETVNKGEKITRDEMFAGNSDDGEAIGVNDGETLDTKVAEMQNAEEGVVDVGSPQSDEFVDVEIVKEESKLGPSYPLNTIYEKPIKNEPIIKVDGVANKEIDDSNIVRNNDNNKNNDGDDFNEDEALEWEDSDNEEKIPSRKDVNTENGALGGAQMLSPKRKHDEIEKQNGGIITSIPDRTEFAAEPLGVANVEEQTNNHDVGLTDVNGFQNDIDNQMLNVDEDEEQIISDPEEEELIRQLANEADEHERFALTLNNQMLPANNQQEAPPDFDKQIKALRNQQKKDRRDADEITQTMITECQQLLSLFGLPYITAPMEAEAQCSRLVELGLVDGIVTDDSDIFLFGGNRVYKNMFNQAKFVECYLSPDITAELGLDRRKLIAIAHLLGSDYTEGLPGIGPVTAVELLSEFTDLVGFRDWYAAVQQGTRPKSEDSGHPFRRKFRRNAAKLFLPPSFPDPVVDDAYLNPVVDNDTQSFEWGVPDLAALRSFLSGTVGWSEERTDEILVPVIRDMNRREAEGTQANITRFFSGGVGAGAFAPRRRTFIEDGQGKGKGSDGSGLVQGQLAGNIGAGAPGRSKRLETALGKIAGRAKGRLDGDGDGTTGINDTINGDQEDKAEREKGSADEDYSDGISHGNGVDEDAPPPAKKKRRSKGVNKESNGKVRNKSKKRRVAADSD